MVLARAEWALAMFLAASGGVVGGGWIIAMGFEHMMRKVKLPSKSRLLSCSVYLYFTVLSR